MAKEEQQVCLSPGHDPVPPPLSMGSDEDLALVQSAIERTTRRLELERRKLHDLVDALEKAQAEYDEKRKRYSFNKADALHEFGKAEKHLRLLENRVAQETSKHNIGMSTVTDLRNSIDKHRKDRISLDQVHRYLTREIELRENELKSVKGEMNALQDEEQQAVSWKERIGAIRDKEREEFKKIILEKEKILKDHDRLLKSLEAKSEKGSQHIRAQTKGNEFTVSEGQRLINPETLMRHILKMTLLNTMQRYAIRQHRKQVDVFEKAMESIKASTGISDADEIVRIFTLLEERNYSAITYVNTINHEIRDIENRKRAILDRIHSHVVHGGKAEKITQDMLKDVTDQIDSITKQVELREEHILAQTQSLAGGKAHLDDCVRRIERTWKAQSQRQTPIEGIADASIVGMLQYIDSFVASRVCEGAPGNVFTSGDRNLRGDRTGGRHPTFCRPESGKDHTKSSNSVVAHTKEPTGNSLRHSSIALRLKDLPTAHADSESDDYDVCERPLTDNELRTRTAQSFLKRVKRDQRGSERRSLPGESSPASAPEATLADGTRSKVPGKLGTRLPLAIGNANGVDSTVHFRLGQGEREHTSRPAIMGSVLSSGAARAQRLARPVRTRATTVSCLAEPPRSALQNPQNADLKRATLPCPSSVAMEDGLAVNQQVPNVAASPEYIAPQGVDVAAGCEADMHEASTEQHDESALFALATNLTLDERDGPAVVADSVAKQKEEELRDVSLGLVDRLERVGRELPEVSEDEADADKTWDTTVPSVLPAASRRAGATVSGSHEQISADEIEQGKPPEETDLLEEENTASIPVVSDGVNRPPDSTACPEFLSRSKLDNSHSFQCGGFGDKTDRDSAPPAAEGVVDCTSLSISSLAASGHDTSQLTFLLEGKRAYRADNANEESPEAPIFTGEPLEEGGIEVCEEPAVYSEEMQTPASIDQQGVALEAKPSEDTLEYQTSAESCHRETHLEQRGIRGRLRVSFCDGGLPGDVEVTHVVNEEFRRASVAERQEMASKAWLAGAEEDTVGCLEGNDSKGISPSSLDGDTGAEMEVQSFDENSSELANDKDGKSEYQTESLVSSSFAPVGGPLVDAKELVAQLSFEKQEAPDITGPESVEDQKDGTSPARRFGTPEERADPLLTDELPESRFDWVEQGPCTSEDPSLEEISGAFVPGVGPGRIEEDPLEPQTPMTSLRATAAAAAAVAVATATAFQQSCPRGSGGLAAAAVATVTAAASAAASQQTPPQTAADAKEALACGMPAVLTLQDPQKTEGVDASIPQAEETAEGTRTPGALCSNKKQQKPAQPASTNRGLQTNNADAKWVSVLEPDEGALQAESNSNIPAASIETAENNRQDKPLQPFSEESHSFGNPDAQECHEPSCVEQTDISGSPMFPGSPHDSVEHQYVEGAAEAAARDIPAELPTATAEQKTFLASAFEKESCEASQKLPDSAVPRASILRKSSSFAGPGSRDKNILLVSKEGNEDDTKRMTVSWHGEVQENKPVLTRKSPSRCAPLDREDGLAIRVAALRKTQESILDCMEDESHEADRDLVARRDEASEVFAGKEILGARKAEDGVNDAQEEEGAETKMLHQTESGSSAEHEMATTEGATEPWTERAQITKTDSPAAAKQGEGRGMTEAHERDSNATARGDAESVETQAQEIEQQETGTAQAKPLTIVGSVGGHPRSGGPPRGREASALTADAAAAPLWEPKTGTLAETEEDLSGRCQSSVLPEASDDQRDFLSGRLADNPSESSSTPEAVEDWAGSQQGKNVEESLGVVSSDDRGTEARETLTVGHHQPPIQKTENCLDESPSEAQSQEEDEVARDIHVRISSEQRSLELRVMENHQVESEAYADAAAMREAGEPDSQTAIPLMRCTEEVLSAGLQGVHDELQAHSSVSSDPKGAVEECLLEEPGIPLDQRFPSLVLADAAANPTSNTSQASLPRMAEVLDSAPAPAERSGLLEGDEGSLAMDNRPDLAGGPFCGTPTVRSPCLSVEAASQPSNVDEMFRETLVQEETPVSKFSGSPVGSNLETSPMAPEGTSSGLLENKSRSSNGADMTTSAEGPIDVQAYAKEPEPDESFPPVCLSDASHLDPTVRSQESDRASPGLAVPSDSGMLAEPADESGPGMAPEAAAEPTQEDSVSSMRTPAGDVGVDQARPCSASEGEELPLSFPASQEELTDELVEQIEPIGSLASDSPEECVPLRRTAEQSMDAASEPVGDLSKRSEEALNGPKACPDENHLPPFRVTCHSKNDPSFRASAAAEGDVHDGDRMEKSVVLTHQRLSKSASVSGVEAARETPVMPVNGSCLAFMPTAEADRSVDASEGPPRSLEVAKEAGTPPGEDETSVELLESPSRATTMNADLAVPTAAPLDLLGSPGSPLTPQLPFEDPVSCSDPLQAQPQAALLDIGRGDGCVAEQTDNAALQACPQEASANPHGISEPQEPRILPEGDPLVPRRDQASSLLEGPDVEEAINLVGGKEPSCDAALEEVIMQADAPGEEPGQSLQEATGQQEEAAPAGATAGATEDRASDPAADATTDAAAGTAEIASLVVAHATAAAATNASYCRSSCESPKGPIETEQGGVKCSPLCALDSCYDRQRSSNEPLADATDGLCGAEEANPLSVIESHAGTPGEGVTENSYTHTASGLSITDAALPTRTLCQTASNGGPVHLNSDTVVIPRDPRYTEAALGLPVEAQGTEDQAAGRQETQADTFEEELSSPRTGGQGPQAMLNAPEEEEELTETARAPSSSEFSSYLPLLGDPSERAPSTQAEGPALAVSSPASLDSLPIPGDNAANSPAEETSSLEAQPHIASAQLGTAVYQCAPEEASSYPKASGEDIKAPRASGGPLQAEDPAELRELGSPDDTAEANVAAEYLGNAQPLRLGATTEDLDLGNLADTSNQLGSIANLRMDVGSQQPLGVLAHLGSEVALRPQDSLIREESVDFQQEACPQDPLGSLEPMVPGEFLEGKAVLGQHTSIAHQGSVDSQEQASSHESPDQQTSLDSQRQVEVQVPGGVRRPLSPQPSASLQKVIGAQGPLETKSSLNSPATTGSGPLKLQESLSHLLSRDSQMPADPPEARNSAKAASAQTPLCCQTSLGEDVSPPPEGSRGQAASPALVEPLESLVSQASLALEEPSSPLAQQNGFTAHVSSCASESLGGSEAVANHEARDALECPEHQGSLCTQDPLPSQEVLNPQSSSCRQESLASQGVVAPITSLGSQVSLPEQTSLHSQGTLSFNSATDPQGPRDAGALTDAPGAAGNLEVGASAPTEMHSSMCFQRSASLMKTDKQPAAARAARETIARLLEPLRPSSFAGYGPMAPGSSQCEERIGSLGTEPERLKVPHCLVPAAADAGPSPREAGDTGDHQDPHVGSAAGHGWDEMASESGDSTMERQSAADIPPQQNMPCVPPTVRLAEADGQGPQEGKEHASTVPEGITADVPSPDTGSLSVGTSSWRMPKVENILGSLPSPTHSLSGALESLASRRNSFQLGENPVVVDDLVVVHAPITAPLPAPRPVAHVMGSSTSSGRQRSAASRRPSPAQGVPGEAPTSSAKALEVAPDILEATGFLEKETAASGQITPVQASSRSPATDANEDVPGESSGGNFKGLVPSEAAALPQGLPLDSASVDALKLLPQQWKKPQDPLPSSPLLPCTSPASGLDPGAFAVRPRSVAPKFRPPPQSAVSRPLSSADYQEPQPSDKRPPVLLSSAPPASPIAPAACLPSHWPPGSGFSAASAARPHASAPPQRPAVYPRPLPSVPSTAGPGTPQAPAIEAVRSVRRSKLPGNLSRAASPGGIAGGAAPLHTSPPNAISPMVSRPPPTSSVIPGIHQSARPQTACTPPVSLTVGHEQRPMPPYAFNRPATPGCTQEPSSVSLAAPNLPWRRTAGDMGRRPPLPPIPVMGGKQPPSRSALLGAVIPMYKSPSPVGISRPAAPVQSTGSLSSPFYVSSGRDSPVSMKPPLLFSDRHSDAKPSGVSVSEVLAPPMMSSTASEENTGRMLVRPASATRPWRPLAVSALSGEAQVQQVARNPPLREVPQGVSWPSAKMTHVPPPRPPTARPTTYLAQTPSRLLPVRPVGALSSASLTAAPQGMPTTAPPLLPANGMQATPASSELNRPTSVGASAASFAAVLPSGSSVSPVTWRPAVAPCMAAVEPPSRPPPLRTTSSEGRHLPPAALSTRVRSRPPLASVAIPSVTTKHVPAKPGNYSPLPTAMATDAQRVVGQPTKGAVLPGATRLPHQPVQTDSFNRPATSDAQAASVPLLSSDRVSPATLRPPALQPSAIVQGAERIVMPPSHQALLATTMMGTAQPPGGSLSFVPTNPGPRPVGSSRPLRPRATPGAVPVLMLPSGRGPPVASMPSVAPPKDIASVPPWASHHRPPPVRLAAGSRPPLSQSMRPPGQEESFEPH